MLVLIVIIGTLNVFLGFGLAMYYGYGPPGLDGIFQSLGPMPPAMPDAPLAAAELGELYIPASVAAEARGQPADGGPGDGPAILSIASVASAASEPPLDEEAVLNDVRQMTAAAQSAMAAGAAQTSE